MTREATSVALVGPDPEGTPGGMATVLREIRGSAVLRDGGVGIVEAWTHEEGPAARKFARAIAAAARIIRMRRGSIAHIHMASGWSVHRKAAIALLARLRGVRVIAHLHGADLVEDIADGGRAHRRIFRATMRAADRVVVLSEYWADWLRGIEPGATVVVVRNAVAVPPSVAPLPETPTVLFLGRLGARKGIWTLLDAIEPVARAIGDVRFVLAGDGDVDAVKAWLAERPESAARTEVRGWVGAGDVPALIDGAWALALPSQNEGLPMSVLESMARGRPVVATRVGGIPDALRDGVDGVLLSPGDPAALAAALVGVLGDRVRCAAMGERARERIRDRYEIDDAMATMLTIYREVATR